MTDMATVQQSGFSLTENGWLALLLSISVITLVFTVYCLSQGITIIFMHLYYFPIILLAYHYHKKGVILSAVLGLIYVSLVIFFTYPVMAEMFGAGARFVVFVVIAAVVAYLSENLEKRERERNTIIANSEDGIFVVDHSSQTITEVNRRGSDMLGFTPGDLVNATLETIWQNTEERAGFSNLIKTGGPVRTIEAHLTQKTGGTLTVLISAGTLPEQCVVLTVTDITDRESMLTEMRKLSDVRESIISNANVWLMVLDSYGRILEWNRAAEQISGYPAVEVIGRNEVWKRLYPERNYRKKITGKITEIIKKDNYLENLQTTIVSKSGTKKTILWNTRGLPDKKGSIGSYIAIGIDITDREKIEQVSREYAEWYSILLRTTQDGYNLVDATGRLIEVNDNYCRMTGFSREELQGRSIYDQDADEEKDVAFAHMQKILATGSDRFETRHRTKGGGAIDVEISVVLQAQKRQFIVFVRDITERKHAEREISKSEEKFHTMADFTADWEYWQGQDKQIIYMSPSCHHITGYTSQEFLADPYLLETIVHPDDLTSVQEHNTVAWETRQALSTDFRIIHRDGTIRWISHACRQVYDENGKALGRRVSNRDITDQKIAAQALRESEEKFRAFFTTSRDCVFITSLDGRWIDFNNSAVELFGYESRDELMTVNIADLYVHPEKRNAHLKIISEQGFSKEYPVDLKKKDGTIINTLITSVVRSDQKGTIIGFQGTLRDVTELKRAEMELQKLASVVRHSGELVGIASLDRKITFLNDAGSQMLGILPADAIGKDFFRFIPDHLNEKVQNEILPASMGRGAWSGDLQYIHQKSGNLIDVHVLVFMITDPATGKPQYMANVSLDITARKRTEEALRTSQILLTEAMDLAHMAHWELDVPTGIFTFNDRFYALYGTTAEREGGYQMPAEVYARTFVHLDDMQVVADETNNAIAATDPDYTRQIEHRIVRRDGEVRHIIVRFGITKDAEGRTVKTHGANQDITERKRMEEALLLSEERYRTLAEASPDQIFIIGSDDTIQYANTAALKMFRLSNDLVMGRPRKSLFPPENYEAQSELLKKVFETREHIRKEERIQFGDRVFWIDTSLVPLIGTKGTVTAILGIARDITQRKAVEEALQLTNAILTSQMEATIDGILVVDESGEIMSYNHRFTEIWGIPPDVIASRSDERVLQSVLDKLVNPGEFLTRIRYLYAHREEKSREEIRLNDTRTLDRYSAPLTGSDGRYYGRVWYFRDITERKRAEEAIQQANRQLNLLSSITRHDILNQLMALKGYLELSHEVIDDPTILTGYIRKEEQAADTIERQITFTRDYQELGVAAPEWQSVNASIHKAIAGLPMRDVHVEVDPNNPEIFADRLFEKVFYNLIDNALRYGGAGMKMIMVSSREIDSGLLITCEDDGVGIIAEDKKRLFTRGFGKNTGLGLFLSREILGITGITITENGEPGKGARFEITVPKGMWRMAGADA